MSFATSTTDCGPGARQQRFRPLIDVDLFTTWNAAGLRLREVLRLRGGRITCPELGTAYPVAASAPPNGDDPLPKAQKAWRRPGNGRLCGFGGLVPLRYPGKFKGPPGPSETFILLGSPGRIRTSDQPVNSRSPAARRGREHRAH